MSFVLGQHPGAVWYKCDFQCHTPRDRNWNGPSTLPGGSTELERARSQWADTLVSAAAAAKLRAIAITDHHDFCMALYIEDAAKRLGADLLVFSGVEITCRDNAQVIAIFDPSTPQAVRESILVKAGGIQPSQKDAAKTCEIQPATSTVAELFEEVQSESYLRDSCVLLPHFSKNNSHKTLNQTGHHPRFADLPCDGVYIECPFSALDQPTVDKIQGKIEEWGRRRRAIVATGDNRSETWERLGAHDCWIKLGEHSVEALRQALLADEARITFSVPETPAERIISMKVKSTLTGDSPLSVTFNDGFTALIGGRGSGKSALLEYLRFGLGRTETDIDPNQKQIREREALLIEETMEDGFVEVTLEREGVREMWRRELNTRDSIVSTDSNGEVTQLTLRAARERFRARAFVQKGLSSTMNDASTAAEQITGIAAAEELDKQRAVDQAILNAKRAVTTRLQQLVAYWQTRLEHRQARERVADLRARLQAVSDRLAAEGVSPEHLATLEQAPKFARADSYLEQVSSRISGHSERIGQIASSILKIDIAQFAGVSAFSELSELHDAVIGAQGKISDLLGGVQLKLDEVQAAYVKSAKNFELTKKAFHVAHAQAVAQQSAHKALIADGARLAAELQTAEALEASTAAKEEELALAVGAFAQAQAELGKLLEERREILRTAAGKVADRSNELLKARLKRDPAPAEYVRAISGILEATHVQDAEAHSLDWIGKVLEADQEKGWAKITSAILAIYEVKIGAGSPPDAGREAAEQICSLLLGGRPFTANQLRRIYQNLDDSRVGAVLSAVPRDTILLKYIDEGRKIPFAKASPGQQASALLELLLRQHAGTLIIDQPEDDLDNRVIMRIVGLIRTSKNSRQLIFTTHNPNIVVNGDADKVIALRSSEPQAVAQAGSARVQLEVDGAIETSEVRQTITKIMEGGEAAFDLRRRKYRFEAYV